jgi:hypothetical protein
MELILFIIVIFVFYKLLKRSSSISREQYLQEAIKDLKKQRVSRSIKDQLHLYQEEYKKLTTDPYSVHAKNSPSNEKPDQSDQQEAQLSRPTQSNKVSTQETVDLGKIWGNWYSDNSINLLLYIGSFFIVASASIFVGFQWETLDGMIKAILLTGLTILFYIFGAWFYSIEKIKNAGNTFIAIASLLIPFNGIAFYNFVFEPMGVPFGIIWLMTSLIALAVYLYLALTIRHKFYTYFAGFGGLSMMISFVNTTQLNPQFYVLFGILFALIMLLLAKTLQKNEDVSQELYVDPIRLSAQVIMPLSLFIGLTQTLSTNTLFSIEVFIALMLASIYYLIVYTMNKSMYSVVTVLLLLPFAAFVLLRFLEIEILRTLPMLYIFPFAYLLVRYYTDLPNRLISPIINISHTLLFTLLICTLLFSASSWITGEAVIALFLACVYSTLIYFKEFKKEWLITTGMLFPVSVLTLGMWFELTMLPIIIITQFIAFLYLLLSSQLFKNRTPDLSPLFPISNLLMIVSFSISYISLTFPSGLEFNLLIIFFITTLFYGATYFMKKEIIYLLAALLLLPISLGTMLKWLEVPTTTMFVSVEALLALYIGCAALYFQKSKQIAQAITGSAITYSFIIICLAFLLNVPIAHILLFNVFTLVFTVSAFYILKNPQYLYLSFIFIASSLYVYVSEILELSNHYQWFGVSISLIAASLYFCSILYQDNKELAKVLISGTIAYLTIGFLLTLFYPKYALGVNILIAVLALDYALKYFKYSYIYISNIMLAIVVWSTLSVLTISSSWYPLCLMMLSFLLYTVSTQLAGPASEIYRKSGLTGSLTHLGLYWLLGPIFLFADTDANSLLIRNAIFSTYGAAVLYGYDAYRTNNRSLGYFASAIAMIGFLWHLSYLGVSEILYYSIPLGSYFLVLALLERFRKNTQYEQYLSIIGLTILFLPTLSQSFSAEGSIYALVLGILGVVVLGIGITLAYKLYMYTGSFIIALSIISQTYSYLFSMPRWIITAVVGILFLTLAIYLMMHRKEPEV